MKTITEFINLPIQNKIVEVYEKGVFLAIFTKYGRLFQLYSYGDFYVETIFNVLTRETELICAVGYNSTSFDKYLEQIKLHQLLQP